MICEECKKTKHALCSTSCACPCLDDDYWIKQRKKINELNKDSPNTEVKQDLMVVKPPHYNNHPKGIECIHVIEDIPFYNLGNAIKYIWRVSWGSKGKDIQDLEKAKQYIDFEINRRSRVYNNR